MAWHAVSLAKLSRPRLYDVLARERLFAVLDSLRERPIVWIAAPPGAGKTTLVASYLEAAAPKSARAHKANSVWYQIDSSDADPATFFSYLGEAVRRVAPRKRALPLLSPEYLIDLPGFTRRYFREFYARLGWRGTFILDNFQEVPDDKAFHQVMAEALAEVPEGVSVFVLSRTEPSPAYGRFVANKMLVRVGYDEIKFSLEETRAVVLAKQLIPDTQIRRFHEQSDGWAAGVVLLLEGWRQLGSIDAADDSESRQDVFNFFAGQIFTRARPEEQHILLHLSFLPRFTAEIGASLSGSSEVEKLLDHLYRRHLFVDRRKANLAVEGISVSRGAEQAENEHIYQFHALFRAFLQHQARETYSLKKILETTQRAGALLEQAGHITFSVDLYTAAHDWHSAAQVILKSADWILAQGRSASLRLWIERLPSEQRDQSPWLQYWLGIAWWAADFSRARKHLTNALQLFEAAHGDESGNEKADTADDVIGQILCIAAIVRSHFFEAFAVEPMQAWMQRFERLLTQILAFWSPAVELVVYSSFQLGAMFTAPALPSLHQGALRVLELMDSAAIDANEKVSGALFNLWYFNLRGDFDLSRRLVRIVEQFIEAPEVSDLNRASWLNNVGWGLTQQFDHDGALHCCARAEQIARENNFLQFEFQSYEFRVFLHVMWGELAEAERLHLRMTVLLLSDRPQNVGAYHLAGVFIAQARRDIAQALHHAEQCLASIRAAGGPFFMHCWGSILVGALVDASRFGAAVTLIAEIKVVRAGSCYEAYDALLAMGEAYLALKQGDLSASHHLLRNALQLCQREPPSQACFVRWMVSGMPVLLAEALKAGIETQYAISLIRKWAVQPPTADTDPWPWPVQIFTLGRFQIQCAGEPVVFARKAPKRLLSLLKALIAFGGNNVPEEKLIDSLWADLDGDAAHQALAVAVRRLRDLLGSPDTVKQQDGKLSLNPQHCWVDALALNRLLNQPPAKESECYDQVFRLYQGHFLPEDENERWTINLRDRLHRDVMLLVNRTALALESTNQWDVAIETYRQGLLRDGGTESFYQGLARCYRVLGQDSEASEVLRHMEIARKTNSV